MIMYWYKNENKNKSQFCNYQKERTCPSFHCFVANGSCPSSTEGSPDCQKHCQMDSALNDKETIIYFFNDDERGYVYSEYVTIFG